MSRQVFLSYKSTEYGIADEIRGHLLSKGISVWMAPDDIRGGQSYADQIPKAIKGCTAFVIMLSDASMHSIWCAREVDRALNEGKHVMPFVIENVPLTDEYSFYLTNVQQYPAYKNFNGELDRLTEDILKLVASQSEEGNRKAIEEQQEELEREKEKEKENEGARERGNDKDQKNEKHEPVKEKREKPKQVKPKTEKKKPEKKQRAVKKADDGQRKSRKKLLIPLAAALACILLVILLGSLTKKANSVTVCGEAMSISDTTSICLDGKELTTEDIAAIGKLKNLFVVELRNCKLPNASIAELVQPNVTRISLKDCGLTDSQFSSLPLEGSAAYTVEIPGSSVSDPSLFDSIKQQLSFLDISRTKLPLSVCEGMTNLETLIADELGASDLTEVGKLTSLKQLSLRNNKISFISALSGLTELTYLDLHGNKITSTAPLQKMLRMRSIDLCGGGFADLEGLENMTVLKTVELADTDVSDISVLSKSKSTLTELYLQGTKVRSIDALYGCNELTTLNIDGTYVADIGVLETLPKLSMLSCRNTSFLRGFSANAPLSKSALVYLDLRSSGIASVSPDHSAIMGANCSYLLLSGTKITAFSFEENISFNIVDIAGLKLDDESVSSLLGVSVRTLIADYSLFASRLQELKGSKTGWDNIYLIDCPLDEQLAAEQTLGSSRVVFITAEQAESFIPELPQSITGE